jgi:hypothetical protein
LIINDNAVRAVEDEFDGGAAQLVADPGDKAEEGFFDGDDQGEDQQGEPGYLSRS